MKKTLHLIETSGPGGAEKMLISLIEYLDKNRYNSIICLLKDGWLNTQLKRHGFDPIIIPQNCSIDFNWLFRIIALIKKREINLIHTHEFAMNTYGSMASAITRVPIITTVHGKNYYWKKWRRRMAYRFVARQSKMIAVSEDIKYFLVNQVGIKEEEITTIYNGINPHLYPLDTKERYKIRQDLGIDEKQPVIGTVGNLYPVKGHTYLLKSAAVVTKTLPEAIFLIAGRGELLKQLQEEVKQLGIKKNIIFLGFREDIPALLQAMDLFVLTSLSEGLPLSVLEAMTSGKPVVATDVGGNPEVVIEGKTGFLVPPKNTEALAQRILLLLKNKDLAKKIGDAGRIRVKKEFSLETMIKRYQKVYENSIEKGKHINKR